MKNLIIGGEGYIGNVLKEAFLNKKLDFLSLDNLIYFKKRIKKKKYIDLSLSNIKKIKEVIKNTDNVILLAGLVGDFITKKYPSTSHKINNILIKKIIKLCFDFKVKKLIFVSTCSNYGILKKKIANEDSRLKPLSLYAKDKVDVEKYILSFKNRNIETCCTILRFATAFGYSNRMRFDLTVNEFTKILYEKKQLIVYDYDTWRPYCHVKDFARLLLLVLKKKKHLINFRIYNAGSSKNNFTKKQIVKKITKIIPGKHNIIYRAKSRDRRDYFVNFDKIKKKLGFSTKYTLEYGIKEIIFFLKKGFKNSHDNYGNYRLSKNKY